MSERSLATGHNTVTFISGPIMLSSPYHRSPSRAFGALHSARGVRVAAELRGLVRSAEPAVVFSSLVHLSVPAFSDACTIDIVEHGELAYRIAHHRGDFEPADTSINPISDWSLVTRFVGTQSSPDDGYVGVMTHRWRWRRPTIADRSLAAVLAGHGVATVAEERYGDDQALAADARGPDAGRAGRRAPAALARLGCRGCGPGESR